MQRPPAYPAARVAAAKVQPHFARHLQEVRRDGQPDPAPEPDAEAIEAMVSAAFWASLRREEGYTPTISLAYVPPEPGRRPLTFGNSIPLAPDPLTRLAPAVERPGIHLGVWREQGELCVWGTIRDIPPFCFVLEVIAPGLLVIKHGRREDSGKFVNVAVLEGDQVKVVNQDAAIPPGCPRLMSSLLGFDSPSSTADPVNVLVQLAVSMRAHGRGGSLLVVPGNSEAWHESIVQPITYPVSPPFSELTDLMRDDGSDRRERRWKEALRRSVDAIAGLTAIDGATVITDSYELLAFGAKIGRREGRPRIESVVVTEPIEGSVATTVHPTELGGTRHLSAAQFVQDQRDGIALVASQDGRFTIFSWSSHEEMVYAHRAETLLL